MQSRLHYLLKARHVSQYVVRMTSPRPRWGAVTVDCLDPERLAQFWAALLGTSVRGRWEQYVNLHPIDGQPVLAFQRVDAITSDKNSLHLDLHVATEQERDQVVDHAVHLGASVLEEVSQADVGWVVLADPEGNRFCVVTQNS